MEHKVRLKFISDQEIIQLESGKVTAYKMEIEKFEFTEYGLEACVKREVSKEARTLLKQIIVDKYQATNISIKKRRGIRFGQPYALLEKDGNKVLVNTSISHCENVIAVCSSENKLVGIDLQSKIKAEIGTLQVFLLPQERKILYKLAADTCASLEETATLIWTIKEALLKAVGIGFRYGFNSLMLRRIDWEKEEIDLLLSEKISGLFDQDEIINLYSSYLSCLSSGNRHILTIAVMDSLKG